MLADRVSGVTVDQRWVPLEDISANLVRAVIASEDVRFCQHNGVDPQELENAFQRAKRDGLEQVRGASTITMQVAKNLFLTNERSLLRKGLELGVALAIDKVWSKRRTMEVYLNIAEWGEGIYGAEAAARHHFGKSAKRLTEAEAALLAVSLPNPEARVAGRPSRVMQKLAGRIRTRKDQVPGAHMCVYP
jgi:monofunctional biosynthetic peptidoglycan transglycosylase